MPPSLLSSLFDHCPEKIQSSSLFMIKKIKYVQRTTMLQKKKNAISTRFPFFFIDNHAFTVSVVCLRNYQHYHVSVAGRVEQMMREGSDSNNKQKFPTTTTADDE